jgi:hypothetical protein
VSEGTAPLLTSAIDGGEWSVSRPCRFITSETADADFVGIWVGPKTGLDSEEENFFPLPTIKPRFSVFPSRNLVAIPTDL